MYSLPKNVYRERIDFSKIKTPIPIPNLIEIQKKSYERFLQMNRLSWEREDVGLQSVFKSVFPISDFRENSSLEFIEYSTNSSEQFSRRSVIGKTLLNTDCRPASSRSAGITRICRKRSYEFFWISMRFGIGIDVWIFAKSTRTR